MSSRSRAARRPRTILSLRVHASSIPLRSLDLAEKFFWLLDHVSCMNFVVFAELDCLVPLADLQAALTALQATQPLLNCMIAPARDGQLGFMRRHAPLPLRVADVADSEWSTEVTAELAVPFPDESCPLARAICLTRLGSGTSVLGLTFHHAIADARSAMTLLRALLRAALTGERIDLAARRVPAAMHSLFAAEHDWHRRPEDVSAIVRVKSQDAGRHGRPAPLPWLDHAQTARIPRFWRVVLGSATTTALLQQCRLRSCTLQGALGAAQLLAERELLDGEDEVTLSLTQPADLRPYLTRMPDPNGLGMYVTLLSASYAVHPGTDFWHLALQIRGDIRAQLARGDGHVLFAEMQTATVPPNRAGVAAFRKAMLTTAPGSVVSNIGDIAPVEGKLPVNSLSFILSPVPYQAVFTAVNSYGGRLFVNINYDAAKLAHHSARHLADRMQALLLQYAAE